MIEPPEKSRRAIAAWLLVCCGMIYAMAVIGAVTRLTESGLSIMEWAPIRGAMPPTSEAEWRRLFAIYQTIDEYREHNDGMTLEQFQSIFWWEYIHRLWGRLIGAVYALPFAWFLLRRRVPDHLKAPLWIAMGLGALQGAVGWYMVSSGFGERTDVSQYRLVLHLGLALVIYSYLLWLALGLLIRREPTPGAARLRRPLVALTALVALTIASGGFVAGLNAGRFFNTFPLMNGHLIPPGLWGMDPWLRNLFENPITAQFDHRALAMTTTAAALALWGWGRARAPELRRALDLLAVAALAQLGLGISALLLAVPVWLGAAHQAGAIALLTASLYALRSTRT